jgi:hypothetical protein
VHQDVTGTGNYRESQGTGLLSKDDILTCTGPFLHCFFENRLLIHIGLQRTQRLQHKAPPQSFFLLAGK